MEKKLTNFKQQVIYLLTNIGKSVENIGKQLYLVSRLKSEDKCKI